MNTESKLNQLKLNNSFEKELSIKKECNHNWQFGYVADLIIYCKKCGKEIDDVYDRSEVSYATHTCENGKLIEIK